MRPPIVRAVAVLVAALAFIAAASPASAQDARGTRYEPEVGQEGKDVIWVPSPDPVVERMLSMAQVGKQDFVIDLGSGDGKIAIMAARKFGARALGIEYNSDMVRLAQRNAMAAGVGARVRFRQGDIFETDFSSADVITLYLLPELNLRLRPAILAMRPGTRVVSHSFNMGDWDPDETAEVTHAQIFFWIVPARVKGIWSLRFPHAAPDTALEFEQHFQRASGTMRTGRLTAGLRQLSIEGARIRFSLVDARGRHLTFDGRVGEDRMNGSVSAGKRRLGRWDAAKR